MSHVPSHAEEDFGPMVWGPTSIAQFPRLWDLKRVEERGVPTYSTSSPIYRLSSLPLSCAFFTIKRKERRKKKKGDWILRSSSSSTSWASAPPKCQAGLCSIILIITQGSNPLTPPLLTYLGGDSERCNDSDSQPFSMSRPNLLWTLLHGRLSQGVFFPLSSSHVLTKGLSVDVGVDTWHADRHMPALNWNTKFDGFGGSARSFFFISRVPIASIV